jgi:hypothetical protein
MEAYTVCNSTIWAEKVFFLMSTSPTLLSAESAPGLEDG